MEKTRQQIFTRLKEIEIELNQLSHNDALSLDEKRKIWDASGELSLFEYIFVKGLGGE
jgi:hypothetical protein